MRRILAFVCIAAFAIVQQLSAKASPEADGVDDLHRAQQALDAVIIHDIFSPPVASRIYAYAHMAAYETFIKQGGGFKSLHGQIKSFPQIPAPEKAINHQLAGVYAFLITAKSLIFSEQMLEDSIENIIGHYRKELKAPVYEASLTYGKLVSALIITWSKQDGYAETRKIRRYALLKGEGNWVPTPPVYMAAVEPNWRKIRTFALDSAAQFKPASPPAFSKAEQSEFYKLAHQVYVTGKTLTEEQRAIASFWDCNPFAVNVHGHISYAVKKLSPGGHWLSIAGLASKKVNADIIKTSAAYTLTAIALFEGFISCWDEKFRSHVIRPESYINAYIDEDWRPLLQTPPFPEYTSGHSVISTASAVVLTSLFGDNFQFNDTSEIPYGLPARHFNSFNEACNEAAISRLYGGIHYLPAIEHGQTQGRKVGELVISRIRLTE